MKYKNIKTGEVVEVIDFSATTGRDTEDYVTYIDSKGNEHIKENLNIFYDFEPIDVEGKNASKIDWEQRRYEIAKEMLSAIYIDDGYAQRADKSRQFEYKTPDGTAREAVRFADALIAELKKGGHNG
ncbi:MAG: hypothetical protein Q4F85_11835 [Prevotella sp.]|nr:hypothetical protein [Prevotella sp.]